MYALLHKLLEQFIENAASLSLFYSVANLIFIEMIANEKLKEFQTFQYLIDQWFCPFLNALSEFKAENRQSWQYFSSPLEGSLENLCIYDFPFFRGKKSGIFLFSIVSFLAR